MTADEQKKLTQDLLNTTKSFMEGSLQCKGRYQMALIGIARKNYNRLSSINFLSSDPANADAMLDLARGLLEDLISVEFMKLKGKELMAEKFFKYTAVEQKKDLEFLTRNGVKPNDALTTNTETAFEAVKKDFEFKPGVMARSWTKCSVENMIDELLKHGVLRDFDKDMLLQGYIMGNRKNHLSPLDALSFLSDQTRSVQVDTGLGTGLTFATVCFFKIVSELAQELGNRELLNSITKMWEEMNTKIEPKA